MSERPESRTSPREWFGVGVRLFALWPLYLAFENLLYFIHISAKRSSAPLQNLSASNDPNPYLLYTIGYVAFAIFLFFATPFFMRLAHPEPVADSEEDASRDEESSASAD